MKYPATNRPAARSRRTTTTAARIPPQSGVEESGASEESGITVLSVSGGDDVLPAGYVVLPDRTKIDGRNTCK